MADYKELAKHTWEAAYLHDTPTAPIAVALAASAGHMQAACIKVLTDHAKNCHPEERAGLLELADRMAAI